MKELINIRRELHSRPELSGSEFETAGRIKKELEKCGPDQILENLGGAGVMAIFKARASNSARNLLLRAELDAISVEEETDLPHSSKKNGVMHACGHDGHMAILIGIARELKKNRPNSVNVCLLFQPAEETGKGAEAVINDERFKNIPFDQAYALHNLPGYKENTMFIKSGVFASASAGVEIHFKGAYSHAAYPEQGINPANTIAALIDGIELKLKSFKKADTLNKSVCTFIKMGEPSFGISPGSAKLGYTIRSATDEGLDAGISNIKRVFEQCKEEFEGEAELQLVEPFKATINSEEGVSQVIKAARKRDVPVVMLKEAFPWSEDFGEFRNVCPITIFGLGAGENHPPLHSEKYDFNDNLIETGVGIFSAIVEEFS
ncbi:MAG: amidohydrolase [Balneolaceae bacterium]|nr:amidohydrolase [Balneolaceae bacterium]